MPHGEWDGDLIAKRGLTTGDKKGGSYAFPE